MHPTFWMRTQTASAVAGIPSRAVAGIGDPGLETEVDSEIQAGRHHNRRLQTLLRRFPDVSGLQYDCR